MKSYESETSDTLLLDCRFALYTLNYISEVIIAVRVRLRLEGVLRLPQHQTSHVKRGCPVRLDQTGRCGISPVPCGTGQAPRRIVKKPPALAGGGALISFCGEGVET